MQNMRWFYIVAFVANMHWQLENTSMQNMQNMHRKSWFLNAKYAQPSLLMNLNPSRPNLQCQVRATDSDQNRVNPSRVIRGIPQTEFDFEYSPLWSRSLGFNIDFFFRRTHVIPQAKCLVLEHSMQFEQEYGSPYDQLIALTDGADLYTCMQGGMGNETSQIDQGQLYSGKIVSLCINDLWVLFLNAMMALCSPFSGSDPKAACALRESYAAAAVASRGAGHAKENDTLSLCIGRGVDK